MASKYETDPMPLSEREQIHLDAAQGFLELGMFLDADAELDRIDPFCRQLPEVLEVRVKIYSALKKWELVQVVAKRLADYEPEEPKWIAMWADALRKTGAIESAKAILLDAVERHPKCPLLHYELACCECVLGEIEVAKSRLEHAVKLDPSLRLRALDEKDLEGIWNPKPEPSGN
jgi:tetratricopeptide (TPR) repeat protein